MYLFQLFSGSWRCYHFASFIINFLHCFVMKGSSRNKFIHTISLSTWRKLPLFKKTIHQPIFLLFITSKRYKKRNTFLPLIMHSNITLMKKEWQNISNNIRTTYEICNLILRSDIVTKTKCAQKLLANICASRGPLLWVRAFLA